MKRITLEATDSTNEYAKRFARENPLEDLIIVAKRQTAGKGRLGRSFESPDGGIYMSLLLHPENTEDITEITAKASVAVARAIEKTTGIYTNIKWVNDLYLKDKKVCGILTEGSFNSEKSYFDYIVVGIGINVYNESSFSDNIRNIATSLFKTRENKVLEELVDSVENEFLKVICENNKDYLAEYKNRSNILGKEIEYLKDGIRHRAMALDINEKAELVVEEDGKKLCLNSGEIKIDTEKIRGYL